LVICCLATAIEALQQFGLQEALLLTSNFWRFTSERRMLLDVDTLRHLELLCNTTDSSEKGSLMWLLRKTKTPFGGRQLRDWISRPLVDAVHVRARHEAVEELISGCTALAPLLDALDGVTDLHKGLTRLHYARCSPKELIDLVSSFIKLCEAASKSRSAASAIRSALLRELTLAIPDVGAALKKLRDSLNTKAATENDKHGLFRREEEYPDVVSAKEAIKLTESELEQELGNVRRSYKNHSLVFKTVSLTEYLIEFPLRQRDSLPATWSEVSRTKDFVRMHTPEVQELLRRLQMERELLTQKCDKAWLSFVHNCAELYGTLRVVTDKLASLDALSALASCSSQFGWVKPEMVGDSSVLQVEGGRHPMVEALLADAYVPNDIDLNEDGERCLLITGPNMGGKSSYIRQMAITVVLAQSGCFVPAKAARLGVFDAIYTRMGSSDSLMEGRSSFLIELSETSYRAQAPLGVASLAALHALRAPVG
jgi:DNA mismatch repair protein MSH3